MNARENRVRQWMAAAILVFALAGLQPAMAQGLTLFYIGATQPIYDETETNKLYGTAAVPGCLVQVILVTNTNDPAPPPFNPDGTVNTNVVLYEEGESAIGALTSPADENPGVYSRVAIAPTGQTRLVARAFNAPDIYSATYYGDSPVFTNGSASKFAVSIHATTNALDNTDSDEDGVIDRLEQRDGTGVLNADSDGDGFTDGAEARAGTNPLDSNSLLVMGDVLFEGGDVVMEWTSVPGKRYEIDCTDDLTLGADAYYTVGSVITASGTTTRVTLGDSVKMDRTNCNCRVVLMDYRCRPAAPASRFCIAVPYLSAVCELVVKYVIRLIGVSCKDVLVYTWGAGWCIFCPNGWHCKAHGHLLG